MTFADIDPAACRARQARLLDRMRALEIDLVIVTQIEHVQWLSGPRFASMFSPAAALSADGCVTLVIPELSPGMTADLEKLGYEVLTYEAKMLFTLRNDQREASSAVLLDRLSGQAKARTVGVEFSSFPLHLAKPLAARWIDIEPEVYRLRRHKEPDELAQLRRAIAATGEMYRHAREIVRPGVNELDVFNELQSVAVRACGEMITGTGNDYACGEMGGPPRDRRALAGELYILDLGPAYRGYFADNCRTLSVDRHPTDRQLAACAHVRAAMQIVERLAWPGARCREIFEEVRRHLQSFPGGTWHAHLGHGIGLFPHEMPHLNPNWDDTLETGDVIAVEPAVYAPDLRAGIRLENNYLITETGLELLSDFPLEL
jgi:Xaa-Pro aminopeptidase